MHSSLRHWCHSSLHSPSHTSIWTGNAGCVVHFIFSSLTWTFFKWQVVIWRSYCAYSKVCWKGSFGLSRLNLKRLLVPGFFLCLSVKQLSKKKKKKFLSLYRPQELRWSQVRLTLWDLCIGPLDAVFLPGQASGFKWAAAWSLGEHSKGSPCRRLHRAGPYPPPGTDGTTSPVCPSASQFGAGREERKQMWSFSCPKVTRVLHLPGMSHVHTDVSFVLFKKCISNFLSILLGPFLKLYFN